MCTAQLEGVTKTHEVFLNKDGKSFKCSEVRVLLTKKIGARVGMMRC